MSSDARMDNQAFEAEVIRLLRAGDHQGAFDLFEMVLGGKVHGYLRMATGSDLHGDEQYEQLREGVREGLPGLTERLGKTEPPHQGPLTLRAWVFTMVHNRLRNWKHRASRRISPMETGEAYVARGPGPHTLLEEKERAEHARRLLAVLTENERRVYVLHVEMELSFEEVAEALGINLGAAKVRYDRARKRLVAKWKEMTGETAPS
jgi:RNA polymerase sigma factor (sigma-70 family)